MVVFLIWSFHSPRQFKTVQIETDLSEYSGNKNAIQTNGLLAKYQN
jgi:hypothetical protein